MKEIENYLFSLKDEEYFKFSSKLTPTMDPNSIIGVRVPKLRDYAKVIYKNGTYKEFFQELPHKYHEENQLHTFVLSLINDYDEWVREMDKFVHYIQDWSECDNYRHKAMQKNIMQTEPLVLKWAASKESYVCRFGVGMLMSYFLDEYFDSKYLEIVANIKSDEYYVNMMLAFYFATALAKQYDSTIPYFENSKLDTWINNKSIQKAIESYRVTDKQKEYLRTLKR